MWRFCLLSLMVIGWTVFAGCQGETKPKPPTAEQKREMQTQMQNVDAEERAAQQ